MMDWTRDLLWLKALFPWKEMETFANTGLSNALCPCLPVYLQHQFVGPGVKWSRELTQAKNNLTN